MSQERQSKDGTTALFREVNIYQTALNMALSNNIPEIVSVGCSTGEEVYSLAFLADQNSNVRFSGIDVNPARIAAARQGQYVFDTSRQDSIRAKYNCALISERCNPVKRGTIWKVEVPDILKSRISFAVHNMMQDPLSSPADLIICANVLMHYWAYTDEDRAKSFAMERNLCDSLKPNGFLVMDEYSFEDVKDYFTPYFWTPRNDLRTQYPSQPQPTLFDEGIILQKNPAV